MGHIKQEGCFCLCFIFRLYQFLMLSDAVLLVSGLGNFSVSLPDTLSYMGFDLTGILMTVLSIATLIMLERLFDYGEDDDFSEALVKGGSFVYVIWVIMFAWMLLLSKDMASTFIYFQF